MEGIELQEKKITVIVLKDGKASIVMVSVIIYTKKGTMTLIGSIVCTMDSVCDPLVPTGNNGTCYRGGLTVFENHQMCNVTSKFPIQ